MKMISLRATQSAKVLVLVGPTASGKTSVGLHLAENLGGEIVSADSRQVYRYMDLGTAKPTPRELARVKHHFVDLLDPNQEFSAGEFATRGRVVIQEIFERKLQPIIVGGSGLYIQALIDGFFDGPPRDPEFRQQLSEKLPVVGGEGLLRELSAVDPVSASRMLPSNTRRITRALEVYHLTGIPLSEHHRNQKSEQRIDALFFGLNWDRSELYERINRRVDRMITEGLVEEVHRLLDMGFSSEANALQTVGYKEVVGLINADYGGEKMIELIKQNSRRYAKRQLTWFRKDKRIRWFPVSSEEDLPSIAREIAEHFEKGSK